MREFLGIPRESVFSPGKVDADRAILEAVAEVLRGRGHRVRVAPVESVSQRPARGTTVFTMCQGRPALQVLREWERSGLRVVNSVDAVLGCHRHRMCERLEQAAVAAPETLVLPTAAPGPTPWPAWLEVHGGWLKRGDVHATTGADVRFVSSAAAAHAAIADLSARGIERAVLQRHVDGVVLKFYAVADSFLAWFPPPEAPVTLAPEQVDALQKLASGAARALDLEVYGGDVVAGTDGRLQLIDLNDWPSYAPCRAAAAEAIAIRLIALSEPVDR